MTTTTPTIKAHPERSITPAPLIPRDSFRFSREETDKRTREFAVWLVDSTSNPDAEPYRVVINQRHKVCHCTCKAAEFGHVCAHLRGLLWWIHHNAAYRGYAALYWHELVAHDADHARRERGRLGTYWLWRVDWSALGDVIAERLARLSERGAA